MKVAALQMVSTDALAENLEQASLLLSQAAAQGAELAVLPEYFCLIGHRSRRALSRFTLSGQLLSGAKRCIPDPPPPRPSAMR